MKTLTLSLKKQWFDMIKAGIKKEEYRECSGNPERASELRDHSNAVQRGKMKQRRLGGEHVLALLGITLKVRMVA